MASKKDKPDQKGSSASGGFIKQNTVGTSNEISFSVLDAKKGTENAPSIAPWTVPSGISTANTWTLPEGAVKDKRKRRTRGRVAAGVIAAVAGVALVALAVNLIVSSLSHHENYVARLNTAISQAEDQIGACDRFDRSVGQALSLPISELDSFPQAMSSESDAVTSANQSLIDIKAQIESLQDHLGERGDLERSNEALDRINAQLAMIEMGRSYSRDAIPYIEDYVGAKTFLDLVLEGDSLARSAAELATNDSMDNVTESEAKSKDARAKFNEAKELIVPLSQKYESMAPFVDYIQLRIDAQSDAIDADEAYLQRSSAPLQEANDSYNRRDKEAADLIATLSGSYPTDIVNSAFESMREADPAVSSWAAESAKVKGTPDIAITTS